MKHPWLKLSQEIAEEIKIRITPLLGKPESGKIVGIGANGAPTLRIDEVAEQTAIKVLKKNLASFLLISEEIGNLVVGPQPELFVVLDPIDGTLNATHGIPFYSVSIGIGTNRTPLFKYIEFGFVENLETNDTYFAFKDKGAFLNNKKISTSQQSSLKEAMCSIYINDKSLGKVAKLCRTIKRIRSLGSVALELCYVADGSLDCVIDLRDVLKVTDIAAAKLILEEAGGIIGNSNGSKFAFELDIKRKLGLIAANKKLFTKVLGLTK